MINIEVRTLRKQCEALKAKAAALQAKVDATPSIEEKRLLEMRIDALTRDNRALRARLTTGVLPTLVESLRKAAEKLKADLLERPPVLPPCAEGPCANCGRAVPCQGVRVQYGRAVLDALACGTACARAVLLAPDHVASLLEVVDLVAPSGLIQDPVAGPGRLRLVPSHLDPASGPRPAQVAALAVQGELPLDPKPEPAP